MDSRLSSGAIITMCHSSRDTFLKDWPQQRKDIIDRIQPKKLKIIHGSDVKNNGCVCYFGLSFNSTPFVFEDPDYGEQTLTDDVEIFFEIYSDQGNAYSLETILDIQDWRIDINADFNLNMSFSNSIRPWLNWIIFGEIVGNKVRVSFEMFFVSEDDYPLTESAHKEHNEESKVFDLVAEIAPMQFYDDRIDQTESFKNYLDATVYDVSKIIVNPNITFPNHRKSYLVPLSKS